MLTPPWSKMEFRLDRYNGIKDTRRFWHNLHPWDWIGGLCYDTGSGHFCILTACTNATPSFAKWKDLYFYLVEYDPRCGDHGWPREGGTFANRLIPLMPPFMTGYLVALYAEMRGTHQGKVDYYNSDYYRESQKETPCES